MAHLDAKTMFTQAVRKLQERYGPRAQYERIEERGASHDALSGREIEFIGARDSFYLASVGVGGWPYVQHRGGPAGFLRVLDPKTLAFADYGGNKQYITAGNLATNDRLSMFLMSYPEQARLKVIGHGRVVELRENAELEAAVTMKSFGAAMERVVVIDVVAFDWNCTQFITPRYTREEILDSFTEEVQLDGRG